MSTKNVPQVLIKDLWSDLRSRLCIPSIMRKTVEVVRLIPQERIQQRTVERIVVVSVFQVVEEMVEVNQIILPEPYHRRQNCRCDSDGTTPSTNHPDNLKKTMEILQMQLLDRVVDVPVE